MLAFSVYRGWVGLSFGNLSVMGITIDGKTVVVHPLRKIGRQEDDGSSSAFSVEVTSDEKQVAQ